MKYKITLNDRTYEVEVEVCEPQTLEDFQTYSPIPAAPVAAPAIPAATPAAAAPAAAPVSLSGGEAVNAPMPGTILKVNVAQGDAVKAGAVLVVLEAMKMENEILAPRDAVVKQVVATKGSTVDTGAPLVVLG